jgi:hypothetical protein
MCEPASAENSSQVPVPASVPTLIPEEIHRLLLRVHRHQCELHCGLWRRQGCALPRANFQALALRVSPF